MKHLLSAAFIIVIFAFASCEKISSQKDITKNISLPVNGNDIINASDNFAFDFLHATLKADNTQGNKLISPLSIYLALSMVCNGADNATADSMAYALRLKNISLDNLNNVCKILIEDLPNVDSRVNLSIANSIWYRQNSLQPLQSFLDITNQSYYAAVKPLNFSDPNSVNIINNWIADNTRQKITEVLDKIDPDDLMFLINAIYFKGAWQYRFDKSDTKNDQFYLNDNSTVSTPFMMQHQSLNYMQNDSVQMAELPYGNGNFNMYVILSDNNIPVAALASSINSENFNYWTSQMDSADLEIHLPKFKYRYNIANMEPELSAMGMGIAFDDRADFSKMYKASVKISKAIHETYIEVNEEGTEAAAATVIGISLYSLHPQPLSMNINHPFLYIIQEKSSGGILFLGIVNNPAEE